MINFFYRLPISYVIFGTIFVMFIWSIALYRFSYRGYGIGTKGVRNWLIFRIFFFTISLFLVFSATIFSRTGGEVSKVILQPFYSIAVAKKHPEMYRSMIMNIVLFIPLGMSYSSLLSKERNATTKVIATTLLGLLISVLIESLQYFYKLGESWTDDIICNVLGAFLGSLTLGLWKVFFLKKYDFT